MRKEGDIYYYTSYSFIRSFVRIQDEEFQAFKGAVHVEELKIIISLLLDSFIFIMCVEISLTYILL